MILRPGPGVTGDELLATSFLDYPVDDALVACVLPVFAPRAAAIIHAEGALCPLRVDEDGVALVEVVTDVVPAIAGGELAAIHPAAPGRRCAYLQSRRMIRYDLDLRSTRIVRMVRGESVVVHAIWLSDQEDTVAVQVEDTSRYDEGGLVVHRLEVFGPSGARSGAVPMPRPRAPGLGWAAGDGLLAVAGEHGLDVFGPDLRPIPAHPLTRAAAQCLAEAGVPALHALRIHPARPLAVFAAAISDVFGLREFLVWRVTWADGGAPAVRQLAQIAAVGDLSFGSFAPGLDAIDLHARGGGVTRLLLALGPDRLLDLGPSRGLQAACWTGPPLRYLAFEQSGAQVVVFAPPEVRA